MFVEINCERRLWFHLMCDSVLLELENSYPVKSFLFSKMFGSKIQKDHQSWIPLSLKAATLAFLAKISVTSLEKKNILEIIEYFTLFKKSNLKLKSFLFKSSAIRIL